MLAASFDWIPARFAVESTTVASTARMAMVTSNSTSVKPRPDIFPCFDFI